MNPKIIGQNADSNLATGSKNYAVGHSVPTDGAVQLADT